MRAYSASDQPHLLYARLVRDLTDAMAREPQWRNIGLGARRAVAVRVVDRALKQAENER